MDIVEMTRVSTKGQVVLPRAIRDAFKIKEGEQLLVLGSEDGILFKRLEKPLKDRFRQMMKESQAWAKKAGLTQKDIKKAIQEARKSSK